MYQNYIVMYVGRDKKDRVQSVVVMMIHEKLGDNIYKVNYEYIIDRTLPINFTFNKDNKNVIST